MMPMLRMSAKGVVRGIANSLVIQLVKGPKPG
jgi:hypothetical protein